MLIHFIMLKKAQEKPYAKYVLTAINAIKQHNRNHFQRRKIGNLLNQLNTPTPNRNCVLKAFKELDDERWFRCEMIIAIAAKFHNN